MPANKRLRTLPSVDRVLKAPDLVGQYGVQACKLAAQDELARLREALRGGDGDAEARVSAADFQDGLCAAAQRRLAAEFSASLKPVYN